MATKKQAAAAAAPTALYTVISPLDHDGDAYAVGDPVDLTEDQAKPLLGHTVKTAPSAAETPE